MDRLCLRPLCVVVVAAAVIVEHLHCSAAKVVLPARGVCGVLMLLNAKNKSNEEKPKISKQK